MTDSASAASTGAVIGIDFGTTSAYVGIYRNKNVEVIANEQGNRCTPAWIAFTNKERIVGEGAHNQQYLNAENTIYHAKRLLGVTYDDAALQEEIKSWPYKVINENNKPMIQVEFKGETKVLSGEELCSIVIGKVRDTAAQYLGVPIVGCVISVPVTFNSKQRLALLESCKLANVPVLHLISEPVAACMAYDLDTPGAGKQNVVVVDIGGAYTDIAVVRVEEGLMEVVSHASNKQGGEWLDEKLLQHFIAEFKRKNDCDLTESQRALTRLRLNCEKAKIVLTSSPSAPIECDALYEGIDFYTSINRSRFESLCSEYWKQILTPIEQALTEAKLTKTDIQKVILVGGTCRVPKVADVIKNYFGFAPTKHLNCDEAVAYGCTLQASLEDMEHHEEKEEKEIPVTQFTIGIAAANGEFIPILPNHSPLPSTASITLNSPADQKAVKLAVYEGEHGVAAQNHHLADIDFANLPASVKQVRVTVNVHTNNTLDIEASVVNSDKHTKVHIADKKRLDDKAIADLTAKFEAFKLEQAKVEEQKKESKEALTQHVNTLLNNLNDSNRLNGIVTDKERSLVIKSVEAVRTWLQSADLKTVKVTDFDSRRKLIDMMYNPVWKKVTDAEAAAAASKQAAASTPEPELESADLD